MGIKENILNKYYLQSQDGSAEISAKDLLQAIEEYKQLAEERAFVAGREKDGNAAYVFKTYADYQVYVNRSQADETEYIKLIADSIMPQFIPNKTDETAFAFSFKTKGINYKAYYNKDKNGYWIMARYTLD